MTSKQKSLVWDFFKKSVDGTLVICQKCQTELKYFGSTSGMLKHVESNHQDEIQMIRNSISENETISAPINYSNISDALNELASTMCANGAPLSLQTTARQKSLVWNFFEKSEDGTQVICQKCQIQLKFFGSTSGMLKHIESNHQDDLKISGNAEIESERIALPNEHSDGPEALNELAMTMCSSSLPLVPQMTSKQKSLVWDFFEKAENGTQVICRKCRTKLKFFGSTSGMLKHIESNHQHDLTKMGKSKIEREKLAAPSKRSHEFEALNELVLTMCTSSVPFSIGKNKHFQKFIHILNPDFPLPSTDAIFCHFASTAKSYREDIKQQLQSVQKCVISVNGWKGKFGNKSLYAMFLYFVDSKFRRTKLVCLTKRIKLNVAFSQFLGIRPIGEPVDVSRIGKLVLDLLIEYDLDFSKVIGGICESRSNVEYFLDRNGRYHLPCGAYSIALIIKNVSEFSSVKEVFIKINQLVSHLSSSKFERKLFQEQSKILQIARRIPISFSDTRRGGCVLLAQAYSDHFYTISALSNFQSYLLSQSEKNTLDEFLVCTKPYMEAIQMSEKEDTYASEIIVQYAGLLDFISRRDQDSDIVRFLKKETTLRYEVYLQNDMALFALYCDPRFVYLPDILRNITWSDVEEKVATYCDALRIVNATTSGFEGPPEKKSKNDESYFTKFVLSKRDTTPTESIKTEIVAYQSMIQSSRPSTSADPLNFWMINSERFPNLSILARHILSSPSSTAQTDRFFSKCGILLKCPQKSRVPSTTFNDMMLNVALADLQRGTLNDCDSEDLDDDEDEIEVNLFPDVSDRSLNHCNT